MGHLPGLAYRALADEHWTALFVSKGVEDLTGYPADEFTSRRLNYADIMLPEDRPATREAVFTALRERRMYEAEHRIRHKGRSPKLFSCGPAFKVFVVIDLRRRRLHLNAGL
jgi:PAS domain-containing protein